MSVSTVSRPPLWARNNARQAIELMDGTPAYVSFLKQKPQPGRVIQKRGTEANIRAYLQDMQTQGRVLITGDRDFIAPCLGTIFVSDGGEVERNVLLSKIEFKIQRSGVVTRTTPFMNIPHHAFVGTTWEDIEFDLADAEQFNLNFLGRSRIIIPHDLDMVKGPLNKPTVQWVMLEQFAYARGRLPIGKSSAQRQKQKLVEKLNAAFGLHDDPFVVESGCYVARFKISADGIGKASRRKQLTR